MSNDDTDSRLLSQRERDRFATWLEQEARDGAIMAANIEKMAGGAPTVMELAKKERAEALAAEIIAKKLRSIESQTIS